MNQEQITDARQALGALATLMNGIISPIQTLVHQAQADEQIRDQYAKQREQTERENK